MIPTPISIAALPQLELELVPQRVGGSAGDVPASRLFGQAEALFVGEHLGGWSTWFHWHRCRDPDCQTTCDALQECGRDGCPEAPIAVRTIRIERATRDALELTFADFTLDIERCAGRAGRRSRGRFEAVVPGLVYGAKATGALGDSLLLVTPNADRAVALPGTPRGYATAADQGRFTMLAVPLERGRSESVRLVVSLAAIQAWPERAASDAAARPSLALDVEVDWASTEAQPTATLFIARGPATEG